MRSASLQVLAKVERGLLQTPVGEFSDQKVSKWRNIVAYLELLKYDLSWMRSHFNVLMAWMEIIKAQERLKLAQVKAVALEQALILAKEELVRCTI